MPAGAALLIRRARHAPTSLPRLSLFFLLALGGLLTACGTDDNRASEHLRRADDFLAAKQGRDALLELHGAAQLLPDDADLFLRIAKLSLEHGFHGDAADFYREALSLRPEDSATALKLALLLVELEPAASAELVDALIAANPRNARAWLVRARAALARGDIGKARQHVVYAQRLAPQDPETDWTLALTHEARNNAARIRSPLSPPSPRVTEETLRAYDRYLEKGGDHPLLALLGRARALARLPNRRGEAVEAYQLALTRSIREGTPYEQARVARETFRYAKKNSRPELSSDALDQWIAVANDDLNAWKNLIELEKDNPEKHRAETFKKLFQTLPDHPGAHGLYAEHLFVSRGYEVAIDYLESQMDQGMDDGILLEAIVGVQTLAQRPKDAARTLRQLKKLFPARPSTLVLDGQQKTLAGDHRGAIAAIQKALPTAQSSRAYRILARAEQQSGHLDRALKAIAKAATFGNSAEPETLRLRAQIESESGLHGEAIASLLKLHQLESLAPIEKLLLARSYYDQKSPGIGRKILIGLLADDVRAAFAVEFAKRDASNPNQRSSVRKYLLEAHQKFPDNLKVLETLTQFDLRDGQHDEIIERLNDAVDRRSWVGGIYLVRGRALLALGHPISARDDAERALRLDPHSIDEAYEILSVAYVGSQNLPTIITSMERRKTADELGPDRIALLGRLQLAAGNSSRATQLYNEALKLGSELIFVKNDLAYLLAESEKDLDRALSLARAAEDSPGAHPTTADTLGYVYLKRGQPDAAIWQFRQAIDQADPPVADYHYHLGLALVALEKKSEAVRAFDRTLEISPDFAAAAEARDELMVTE